ncbi:hypothetical protein FPV67DRAFT_1675710 [Lyophyllum atratum]|nr:hypothetical protein FPV67DRAFT_1675710 [Lyophyllum atratum]
MPSPVIFDISLPPAHSTNHNFRHGTDQSDIATQQRESLLSWKRKTFCGMCCLSLRRRQLRTHGPQVEDLREAAPDARAASEPRLAAHGYIYSTSRKRRLMRTFAFEDGSTQTSPIIHVSDGFSFLPGQEIPPIHTSNVKVGGYTFLCYGYFHEASPPNMSIEALKAPNPFKGEIAVFVKGTMVPVLSRPRVKKSVMDKAVLV